jgi:hypothetical protein
MSADTIKLQGVIFHKLIISIIKTNSLTMFFFGSYLLLFWVSHKFHDHVGQRERVLVVQQAIQTVTVSTVVLSG